VPSENSSVLLVSPLDFDVSCLQPKSISQEQLCFGDRKFSGEKAEKVHHLTRMNILCIVSVSEGYLLLVVHHLIVSAPV
jgi:hypothetical protein